MRGTIANSAHGFSIEKLFLFLEFDFSDRDNLTEISRRFDLLLKRAKNIHIIDRLVHINIFQ